MRPTSSLLSLILLTVATVASAQPNAPRPAEARFHEIERELRVHWEALQRSIGRDPRNIRRIEREQGDRLIRAWRDYLARYADSPRAFEARNYMLQGFVYAGRRKAAAGLLDQMEQAAKTPAQAAMVAAGYYHLDRSAKPAIAALERFIGRTEDRAQKAAATLAMRGFARGQPIEAEAQRLAVSRRVLRDYPDTPAGRIAAKQVRAAGLRPGVAPIELDRYRDTRGKPLRLAALRGHVVVLYFWVSWSAASRTSLELLDRLMDGEDDPIVIAINCDVVRSDFDRAIGRLRGQTWRHYFDGRGEANRVAEEYAIEVIPQTLVIGRDGRLAATGQAGESAIAAIKAALERRGNKKRNL